MQNKFLKFPQNLRVNHVETIWWDAKKDWGFVFQFGSIWRNCDGKQLVGALNSVEKSWGTTWQKWSLVILVLCTFGQMDRTDYSMNILGWPAPSGLWAVPNIPCTLRSAGQGDGARSPATQDVPPSDAKALNGRRLRGATGQLTAWGNEEEGALETKRFWHSE